MLNSRPNSASATLPLLLDKFKGLFGLILIFMYLDEVKRNNKEDKKEKKVCLKSLTLKHQPEGKVFSIGDIFVFPIVMT